MSPHPTEVPPDQVRYESAGARSAWVVLGATFALATLLGVLFFARYSQTMVYVKQTLEEPTEPPAWEAAALAPAECVDAALDWASGCSGIKSMCDMYVDHAIALCMQSRDREEYCASVSDEVETRFGSAECHMRGVRRNVDAEACANAYKAILSYCESLSGLDEPASH